MGLVKHVALKVFNLGEIFELRSALNALEQGDDSALRSFIQREKDKVRAFFEEISKTKALEKYPKIATTVKQILTLYEKQKHPKPEKQKLLY